MRVLVIGSGAREHALLLALRRDPEVESLAIAPGNAGTAAIADQHDVDITSGDEVVALAQKIGADLVVIGPEVPLVLGVADAVRAAGIACFGPTKEAARIEGSKSFAKDVMAAAGVRTARQRDRRQPRPPGRGAGPVRASRRATPAWVVKDDGLAAGKGVVVTTDRDAARGACGQPARRAGIRCCSSRSSTVPRCRCSVSSTARPWCHCCPRRTSSGSATATPDPTPAAWAPTRRWPGCPTR